MDFFFLLFLIVFTNIFCEVGLTDQENIAELDGVDKNVCSCLLSKRSGLFFLPPPPFFLGGGLYWATSVHG